MKISAIFLALMLAISAQTDLRDMNVVIMGDSITWLGKDDCSGAKGWTSRWKEIVKPRTCRSYARSGATWSNTPATRINTTENIGVVGNDNTIFNQVMRLDEAIRTGGQPVPDLIIIAAGTNDLWYPKYRPYALDADVDKAWRTSEADAMAAGPSAATTMAEAVRLSLAHLKQIAPSAKVVILTPLQCTAISAERMSEGSQLLENAARRGGAYVIRQDNEMPVDSAAERRHRNLTYDGVHTSEAGATANGEALARRIIEVIAD